jgi:hypothetical protein
MWEPPDDPGYGPGGGCIFSVTQIEEDDHNLDAPDRPMPYAWHFEPTDPRHPERGGHQVPDDGDIRFNYVTGKWERFNGKTKRWEPLRELRPGEYPTEEQVNPDTGKLDAKVHQFEKVANALATCTFNPTSIIASSTGAVLLASRAAGTAFVYLDTVAAGGYTYYAAVAGCTIQKATQ